MKTSGLATPAFVLDVDTLKANMAAMNKILEKSSLKLRPHYKSHKCASLAKWQKESEDNFYFYMLRRNGRHTPRIQLFSGMESSSNPLLAHASSLSTQKRAMPLYRV